MQTPKVSREVALEDIHRWLDAKKVMPGKREENEKVIDTLVEEIMYGYLTVNDDCTITQRLKWPLTGESGATTLDELIYRLRITTGTVNNNLKALKSQDGFSIIQAYASAVTGQPSNLLSRLDTEDARTMQAIVTFFV